MMSRNSVLLALLLVFSSAQGSAQTTGYSDLAMRYSDFGKPEIARNEALVAQMGSANHANLDQQVGVGGTGNYAQVEQTGASNAVMLNQYGSANRARIVQVGSFNDASVEQYNARNSLDLSQTGTGNRVTMRQTGDSAIAINQAGDYNVIDAPQMQPGVSGSISETGNYNSVTVSPGYSGPRIAVDLHGGFAVTVQ